MDDIIKKLIASEIFKKPWRKILILSITILYICIAIYIVFGTIFGSINNVDKVSGIFINIGIILFILSFVALMTEGDENQEIKLNMKKEEKVLNFLNNNEGKYTKRDELIKGYKEYYNGEELHSPTINKLKTTTVDSIGNIRTKKEEPFIETKGDKKFFYLTKFGKKYIEENLIEK